MDRIFVIDADFERRAEVCRIVLKGDAHAEPFESVSEFLAFGGSEGIALVHDADGATIGLCEKTRHTARPVPVIGYAAAPPLEQVVTAMQAGAASYFAWPFALPAIAAEVERLGPALRLQRERRRHLAQARALLAGLTAREREVLVCLITHGTNKAIANHLQISPRTVEKYRAAILKRLGVLNSAQAIRIAVEGGALDDPETASLLTPEAAKVAMIG
ncbi:response regulator transcription factor [Alteriqipengyuania sp. 357]